ncbi:MAG: permease-like cell division protein FtsX, partial [Patescibacteria group bacterium]
MFTVISRIVNYGFKNFWRNGWLSAATIAIMLLALLVFGSLVLFRVVTKEAINSVRDKIDISVYFKSGVEEDEMLAVQQSLESIPEVENVEYVSVDEALKRFKENNQD